MKGKIVTKPAFRAVGFKRMVTFEEANARALHGMIEELRRRWREIPYVKNPERMVAVSHPVTDTGFTFYILMEVAQVKEALPAGMMMLDVPTLTYAVCSHEKGQNIEQSYSQLYEWIEKQGYQPDQSQVTHLEFYPMTQDLENPHFDIWIPVKV